MKNTVLQVKNLSKSYRQGNSEISVLKGLNLEVSEGESISIVGQSGSGKSTLLSLLAGLDHPDEGNILLSGQEITTMDEKSLARYRGQKMGIIFQQFHLMPHLSAFENVTLPLDVLSLDKPEEKAGEALNKVGLNHRIKHYPHEMSGGENQRIAIARAFATQPSLLLADEPSGNLDSKTGEQVMDILFKMTKEQNMTIVLVTHNESLAQLCDRQLTLHNGQLVES